MPTAKGKRCEYCGRLYYATRSDSMYCSPLHRSRARLEALKFERDGKGKIPQSGHVGVTKHLYGKWHLKIKGKYLGAFRTVEEAVKFKNEYLGQKEESNHE